MLCDMFSRSVQLFFTCSSDKGGLNPAIYTSCWRAQDFSTAALFHNVKLLSFLHRVEPRLALSAGPLTFESDVIPAINLESLIQGSMVSSGASWLSPRNATTPIPSCPSCGRSTSPSSGRRLSSALDEP